MVECINKIVNDFVENMERSEGYVKWTLIQKIRASAFTILIRSWSENMVILNKKYTWVRSAEWLSKKDDEL